MMSRIATILLAISLVSAGAASAAVSSCYIVNGKGGVANWLPLYDGGSDSFHWLRAGGSINGDFKLVVKFDSGSGFFKRVYKAKNVSGSAFSEVNFGVATDWSDETILGPAKLIVKTADSKCTYNFVVVNAPFESVDVPKSIPDASFADSTVTVSGIDTIQKVRVSFWIQHPNAADLDIQLIGPDNTTVTLSSDNGGTGNDYGTHCFGRTIFDDQVLGSITAGAAPFDSIFSPEEPLTAFNGKSGVNANGQWTLRVTDDTGGSVGQLLCWALEVID